MKPQPFAIMFVAAGAVSSDDVLFLEWLPNGCYPGTFIASVVHTKGALCHVLLLVDDVVFVTLIDHVAAAAAVATKWSGTFVLDRASTRSHLL